MAGVTIYIYIKRFPLFNYGLAIVAVFYIGLSFSHPDYWIARYNLNSAHLEYLNEYDVIDNTDYLCSLSSDAAPILLNKEKNPYLQQVSESYTTDAFSNYSHNIQRLSEEMHIRNFNFSVHAAEKYID